MDKETHKEFYIGYIPKAPPRLAAFIKKVVIFLILLVAVLALYYVVNEKGFVNSTNALLQQTELQGIIYKKPFPMIKVFVDDSTYQSIPLTGYGKFGAEETIATFEHKMGDDIEKYQVTVKGGMVYYDGRAMMQLNPDTESLMGYELLAAPAAKRTTEMLGDVNLSGEIVDSKCYFGAMNPGYGKIHLSCAVRCISGGIPPVLVVKDEKGFADYFLLIGKDGNPVNADLLSKTDLPVQVQGTLEKVDDWFVLQVDSSQNISTLAANRLDAAIQLCANF